MIWRSCERLGILPPNLKRDWEENTVWAQSQLIAFESIRNYEEAEALSAKI